MAHVSINIVVWNSMRYLPDLLASVYAQTYQHFSVLIIDNGSTDGAEEFVRARYPQAGFLRNARNLGFAAAHNQGIRLSLDHSEPERFGERFVLVTNPDIILTPGYLETLMREASAHPEAGAFGGKLFRAFGENLLDDALKETVRSDILDSTGIVAYKNRRFADRGAGEMDEGQYDDARDVFGISGALALYRASALADARDGDAYFDPDFFAYKEDVDLAWRMRLLKWGARYVPSAHAYHYRGLFGRDKEGLFAKLKSRRSRSQVRNYYSARNHWWLLMKNEHWADALFALPRVLPTEFARVCYASVFEPRVVRGYAEALLGAPRMLARRGRMMRRRKAAPAEIRKWFV